MSQPTKAEIDAIRRDYGKYEPGPCRVCGGKMVHAEDNPDIPNNGKSSKYWCKNPTGADHRAQSIMFIHSTPDPRVIKMLDWIEKDLDQPGLF